MRIHWHFENPWRQKAIYVPIEDLLPLTHKGYVSAYGEKLDAYILRQPDGSFQSGVRYGVNEDQYLSPSPIMTTDLKSLVERHNLQWRPCRWDDELTRPTQDGIYVVRIAGDSETEGPHVYYEFPDYTTTAMVKLDNGEGDVFVYCEHDEEPEHIIAWYGPLTAPACDCY
jgi:hypothetical protein